MGRKTSVRGFSKVLNQNIIILKHMLHSYSTHTVYIFQIIDPLKPKISVRVFSIVLNRNIIILNMLLATVRL